jgi:hypothetical protein
MAIAPTSDLQAIQTKVHRLSVVLHGNRYDIDLQNYINTFIL